MRILLVKMPDDIEKYFVNAFLKFLKTQISNQNFSSDVVESLEVAVQCLEAAYEINSNNEASGPSSAGNTDNNLLGIACANIDLFELFQSTCIEEIPNKHQKAEDIKNDGNHLMKEGKFNEALYQYNRAIRLDPTNPILYCNRAAAYTKLNEFNKAIADCKMSLSYNINYGKAYGRMGVAYANLQKFDEAREAYARAIELEPNNQDYQNNLRLLEKRPEMNALDLTQAIFQNLPNNDFKKFLGDLMADPFIASSFSAMTSANSDEVLNKTRQLVLQLINDDPGFLPGIRQQLINIAQQQNQQQGSTNNENAAGPSHENRQQTESASTTSTSAQNTSNSNIQNISSNNESHPPNNAKSDECPPME